MSSGTSEPCIVHHIYVSSQLGFHLEAHHTQVRNRESANTEQQCVKLKESGPQISSKFDRTLKGFLEQSALMHFTKKLHIVTEPLSSTSHSTGLVISQVHNSSIQIDLGLHLGISIKICTHFLLPIYINRLKSKLIQIFILKLSLSNSKKTLHHYENNNNNNVAIKDQGQQLTRSGPTHPEVSSMIFLWPFEVPLQK